MENLAQKPPRIELNEFTVDDVKPICQAKLEELEALESGLIKKFDYPKLYQSLKASEKYSFEWLKAYATLYEAESEREKIEVWRKYWQKLGGLNKLPQPQKGFSEEQIQKAREYPIQDLLDSHYRNAGGGKLKTTCPFHAEKTPSFTIYTIDNSAYCYGCNKSISGAISFLMERDKLSFPDAVNYLNE